MTNIEENMVPVLLSIRGEQYFDGGKAAEVRQIYMDAVTKAVRRDFSSQIGDWCREHGVQYIGPAQRLRFLTCTLTLGLIITCCP